MLTATQYIEKKKVLETALTILLTRRFNGADNSGPTINTIYEFYSCYKVEGFLQMKKKKRERKAIYAHLCVCFQEMRGRSSWPTNSALSIHQARYSAFSSLMPFFSNNALVHDTVSPNLSEYFPHVILDKGLQTSLCTEININRRQHCGAFTKLQPHGELRTNVTRLLLLSAQDVCMGVYRECQNA